MITSTVETITPAIAEKYLSLNTKNNRRVNDNAVASYASDMKNGNWKLTHQGIAFDTDGDLIDGQHRLNAVIKAGIPVEFIVIRGLEPGAMHTIDAGRNRTMAYRVGLLTGNDVRYTGTAIATANALESYFCGEGHRKSFTSADHAQETVQKWLGACQYASHVKSSGDRYGTAIIIAELCAMEYGVSYDIIKAFSRCVSLNGVSTEITNVNWSAAMNISKEVPNRSTSSAALLVSTCNHVKRGIYMFANNMRSCICDKERYPVTELQLKAFSDSIIDKDWGEA